MYFVLALDYRKRTVFATSDPIALVRCGLITVSLSWNKTKYNWVARDAERLGEDPFSTFEAEL